MKKLIFVLLICFCATIAEAATYALSNLQTIGLAHRNQRVWGLQVNDSTLLKGVLWVPYGNVGFGDGVNWGLYTANADSSLVFRGASAAIISSQFVLATKGFFEITAVRPNGDTGYIYANQHTQRGRFYDFGFANFRDSVNNTINANLFCAKKILGNWGDMVNINCWYDSTIGNAGWYISVRPDTLTFSKNRNFYGDKNGVYFKKANTIVFSADTLGMLTCGSLDSVSIYAITPTAPAMIYCSDCSGNGITGRFLNYVGSAWRRIKYD